MLLFGHYFERTVTNLGTAKSIRRHLGIPKLRTAENLQIHCIVR